MPSIRVYALPEIVEEMSYSMRSKLSETLRQVVASSLSIDIGHVEVLWIPIKQAVNAGPLNIEVMYSVTPDLYPDEEARVALAENLAEAGAAFTKLPEGVYEVTAWVLPQHEAIFKVVQR